MGISNYLNQTEKYSTGSNEGPIYSTIDPTSEDLRSFSAPYSQHATPYASTPIMPFSAQGPVSPQQDAAHWMPQPSTSGAQYAQPDRSKTDNGTHTHMRSCNCCSSLLFLSQTETFIFLLLLSAAKHSKQKSMGKAVKTPSLTWMEPLPPPPPSTGETEQYADELDPDHDDHDIQDLG